MNDTVFYAQRALVPTVVVVLAIATYTDYRWRLIKNILTIPTIALGLLLHSLGSGWTGLYFALFGLAAGFAIMMLPFYFGQMGGGDVKLMASLGSLLGAYAILNVFFYTTLAGGLLALAVAVWRKQGRNSLLRTWQMFKALLTCQSIRQSETNEHNDITLPYGIAITAGTLTYLIMGNIV